MHSDNTPILGIIIPCYNEDEIITESIKILTSLLQSLLDKSMIHQGSFILFIDDGSSDNTFVKINDNKNEHIKIIKLTSNKGQQYALLAGLHYSANKVDCIVSLDADLQHDINIIPDMISAFKEGYSIVYGIRKNQQSESILKQKTSLLFYWLMKKMGVTLIKGHADFRLLSKKALAELSKYKETNLFLRGIFPIINLKSKQIFFDQKPRKNGKSKYSSKKMISLAISGITAFSNTPIRLISFIGFSVFFITLLLSINVLVVYLSGRTVPGWASITLPMYFLGGIQLLCLGVIGEYVSKIYKETKARPHYHIEEIIE